ncbi:hypothetical protein [Nocardiopsis quinghaiensis]|uniref:hypothetical protein n=1 Tax=Nocardiopsis quinghaiensis TaxID=464995 RepID=UPI00123B6875|nr:hypothetical protein [Nocardiopsis quinghaiensis]
MTKKESAPKSGPASRLAGLGHTGVPCGYPGCGDRNASESVIRGRGDIDHDFGGTSMEPRCTKHRGMEAPRAPRPRKPLPVDPGWKADRLTRGRRPLDKVGSSADRSGLRTGRFVPAPRPIDVPELSRMRMRAKGFLAK